MNAIGYIIYGIPLEPHVAQRIFELETEWDDDTWEQFDSDTYGHWEASSDAETLGFHTVYHGSAPHNVGWCGEQLGTFNEGPSLSLTHLTNYEKAATPEVIQRAKDRISRLPKELRALYDTLTPSIHIVWGTS